MLVPCGRTCVTRHDMTWHEMPNMTWQDMDMDMTWACPCPCHVMACDVMACHACHNMTWHDVMACHAFHVMHFMSCMSCHVMPCYVHVMSMSMSCHAMHVMPCHVMSCHAIEFSTLQSIWQWNSRQMHASVLILYKVQVPQCGSCIFPCVFAHCICPDRIKHNGSP